MHANKPEMAKRWEKHTPKGKKLPKKVADDKEGATMGSEKSIMQKAADLMKLDAKGISPPALTSIMQGQLDMALKHPGMVALVSRRRERLRRLKDEIKNPGMHVKPEKPEVGPAGAEEMGQQPLPPAAPGTPVPPSNHMGMFPEQGGVPPGAPPGAPPGVPMGMPPGGGMNVAASDVLLRFAKRAVTAPAEPVDEKVAKVFAFKLGFFRKVAECGMLPRQFEAAMIKKADEGNGSWLGRKLKQTMSLGKLPMMAFPLLAFGGGMAARHLTRPEYSSPEELRTVERVALYKRLGREARMRAQKLQVKRKAKLVDRGEQSREADVRVPELTRTA